MAETQVKVIIDAKDNASSVIKAAGMAATVFLGSLTALATGAIVVASSFEQNRISFETMLGSADKAKEMMTRLAKFTLETPFEMPQVVQGAKSLMAYGIEAEKIIPTFKMLGDIAAGVGMDKLPNLVLAFGQVKAATRLTGMELRQFTEAGVPLLDMLAQQMGKTVAEIKDMVSAGEIGFSDVEKALVSLTGKGGKFQDLMLKQSKSFSGLMSNIRDKITQTMSEIAGVSVATGEVREGSLFAVLKSGAEKLYALLDVITPKLVTFTTELSKNQGALMILAGIIGGLLVAAFLALATAAAPAIVALLPFIAIGAVIGAIAYLIYQAWTTNFMGIQQLVANFVLFVQNAWAVITVAVQAFLDWMNTTVLPVLQVVWETISKVFQAFVDWLMGTFFPALQNFFTFVGNVIAFQIAIWQLAFAIIKTVLQAFADYLMNTFGPWINLVIEFIKAILPPLIETWRQNFKMIMLVVKTVADWFTTYAMPVFQDNMNKIGKVVEFLKNAFEENFNKIKSFVEGAISFIGNLIDKFRPEIKIGISLPDIEGAWNNLKSRARNLGIPGFQTGGIVPGPIGTPVPIMAHAGERVIPTGLSKGEGGGGITFQVSIGLYAGTETEKRNIARSLYAALVQVAQSQNKSVRELMGG